MTEMYSSELNGVADWMLECERFACWENEIARPNRVAAGYVASVPQNPFYGQLVLDLKNKPTVLNGKAWETVGPLFFTTAYRQYQYVNLTVFPSHFFIPRHYTGVEYTGSGPIYAKQAWASTKVSYNTLHQLDDFSAL